MTILYVDVSHHDWNRRGGNLDWAQVRATTSSVMVARATYGDPQRFSPVSRFFPEFQRGALAAGFTLRGGYHNMIRGDVASMRRQVDFFRRELDAQACQWAMVDIERYEELVQRDLWPRFDDVLRFRDAWHRVESRPLAYYLPMWLWSGYYGGASLRQLPGPLVQSHYAGGDGTPWQIYANAGGDGGTGWDDFYGGRIAEIWQFTAVANVAGASSSTDVNAFRGSMQQLTTLLTGDDMEQSDRMVARTNAPGRTIGDFMGDVSNLRDWQIGAGELVPGSAPGTWPRPGSPAWNLEHLPELFDAVLRRVEMTSVPQLSEEQLGTLADMVAARLASVMGRPDNEEDSRYEPDGQERSGSDGEHFRPTE